MQNGGASANLAGGELKSEGTFFWTGTNTGGSNLSGFSALPGGYRNIFGTFNSVGIAGYYWSNTGGSASNAYSRALGNSTANVSRTLSQKIEGLSVRCVRD